MENILLYLVSGILLFIFLCLTTIICWFAIKALWSFITSSGENITEPFDEDDNL